MINKPYILKAAITLLLCLVMNIPSIGQIPGPGVDPNAVMLDDFETGSTGKWQERPGKRGEKMSIELMDAENGDPVRFGRYAMKVNIDFTNAQAQQTLVAQVTPTDPANLQIPGNDKGGKRLGMWVYATPEVQGVWFRVSTRRIGATSGVTNTDLASSINWTGWKYMECDLPSGHEFHPDCIRFLVLKSAENYYVNGHVIIDNIRITDKSFKEDHIAPAIHSFTGNGEALNGTIATSRIDFAATFSDTGDSASGIDYSSISLTVDGNVFKAGDAGFSVDESANSMAFTGLSLSNGVHKAKVQVADRFGNISEKESTFTIEASDGRNTTVAIEAEETAYVGTPFKMNLTTNNPKDVKELTIICHLNNIGSVADNAVTFAESAKNSTYAYNPRNGELTLNIQNDIATATASTLASVNVTISKNSNPTDVLRCSPVSAKAVYADNSISLFSPFEAFSRNVAATMDFTIEKRVVGMPGEVKVTDMQGNPIAGATVYAMNEDLSATVCSAMTDAAGIASGMNFTEQAQAVNIYAEKDGAFTYTRLVRTLQPLLTATPEYIRSGATPDPTTQKSITWMCNPVLSQGEALIKFAKKADGEAAFKTISGETKILEYNAVASNGVTKGNAVVLSNLDSGTTYIYQVGDGTNWSKTLEFTTTTTSDQFSFSAFGDLQASSTGEMNRYIAAAQTIESMESRPFFSLNVGDVVDSDDRYDFYSFYGHLFNQQPGFANIDILSGYGNHEYMGNVDADNVKFINGHHCAQPSENYDARKVGTGSYAVEYGNMIVIQLDWEHRGPESASEIQQEQITWIDEVLSRSDKTWKVISLHYPIYPNASTPGSQALFDPILKKHGVQIVFCGHGHTYERVQVEDGKYLVEPGDRRTFTPAIGGTMHIQLGDMTGTGRNGRWLNCKVNGQEMTVNVYGADNKIVENECFTLYAAKQKSHKVNFSVAAGKGSIEATVDGKAIADGDAVEEGKDIVLKATPDEGFVVKDWSINGKAVGSKENTLTVEHIAEATDIKVEFDINSSIDGLENTEISIFPNPCADFIFVEGAEGATLRITDLSGATLASSTLSEKTESVDMSCLTAGIYFVIIEKDGASKVTKVIKNAR